MLKFKWTVGAAVLLATLNLGRAAADETYDLRGPAPEKGQVFVSKGTLTIKNADTTVKVDGATLEMKTTIAATSEEEVKLLAVDGRDVTKCQTKVVKEFADITATFMGNDTMQTEEGVLAKETIISERDGKKWKHVLVDTKPSDKQKKELNSRVGVENDDDLYPAEKAKVGHKWTVDGSALNKSLGNSFTDLKGKVGQRFVKIDELNGEKVAVIESTGKLTGKMKDDESEPTTDVELELTITAWRSLKTGVNVKEKFEGKIKLSGKVKVGEDKAEMTMSGPISGESTMALKTK